MRSVTTSPNPYHNHIIVEPPSGKRCALGNSEVSLTRVSIVPNLLSQFTMWFDTKLCRNQSLESELVLQMTRS